MQRPRIPPALRARVAEQARHRCGYCWLICTGCNKRKGNRIAALDPETMRLVPLFDPRRNVWREHFGWSADGTHIIGLTPVGRGTVAALGLNRAELVRARRRWVAVGWHPPAD